MKSPFKTTQLSKVADVSSGYSAPKKFSESGYPFIRAGSLEELINNPKSIDSLERVNSEYIENNAMRVFPKGSVVFAKSGMSSTKNRYYQLEEDSCVVNHLAIIEPGERILSSFLKYYFSFYKTSKLIVDLSYPSIRISDIRKMQVPLPPLKVQQQIVEILDEADALRKKREKSIKKLKELKKAIFYDIFGDLRSNTKKWPVKPFSHFAVIDTNMTKDFDKFADKPLIGIANIESNTGKLLDYKTVSQENPVSGKYIFNSKHIIFSKIRPNLNKVALPTFEGLCSADAYPILVNTENTNRYFFATVLRSQLFLDYILKHSQRTNIPKANKKQLEGFICPAPPVELQNKFESAVLSAMSQEEDYIESLNKTSLLFNSLLQRAFKGELVN